MVSKFEDTVFEDEEYVLNLPYHLVQAGMTDDLFDILIEFEFLDFKISAINPQSIIEDFNLALQEKIEILEYKKDILKLINDAIKLSANILINDVSQFSAQLWGRLQEFDLPEIQEILNAARQSKEISWLRPLKPSLTKPGGNLVRTFTEHNDCVEHVSVTPDGKHIISCSRSYQLKIWDIETVEVGYSLTNFSVDALFSINNSKFAIAGSSLKSIEAGSPDSIIKIIDWKNNNDILTISDAGKVRSLAITRDCKNLISGMEDGNIQIWDLESNNCIFTFSGHEAQVGAIVITPDNKIFVSAADDGLVKVWDLYTKEEICTFSGHGHVVRGLAITPDGNQVVSASDDDTLKVWDLASKRERLTLFGHTSLVRSVVITPDGKCAISASADDDLKVWDLVDGRELLTLSGHAGWIADLAITPDGRQIVSASWDKTVKIWDIDVAGEKRFKTPHGSSAHSLLITPDSQRIISASTEDGKIIVWNTMGSEVLSFSANKHFVSRIALFSDGRNLLSAAGTIFGPGSWYQSDNALKIWDLKTGTELLSLLGHSQEIRTIAISPDERRILSGSRDKTVRLWDIAAGKEIFILNSHKEMIDQVVFSANGKKGISVSGDGMIKVWNLVNGEELFTLFGNLGDDWKNFRVDNIIFKHREFSSHNCYFELLEIWDSKTEEKLSTLTKNNSLSSLLITEDGKKAISGSKDGIISVWDLEIGKISNIFSGHNGEIYSLFFFPDGQYLASTAEDNSIKIWKLSKNKAIATFIAESPIGSYVVAPKEMLIVAGDWTGNVHFLKLENMK